MPKSLRRDSDGVCDSSWDASRKARKDCHSDENPQQTVLRDDLLQIILAHLPWRQVLRLRCVSRRWREAVDALQLWCDRCESLSNTSLTLCFEPFESILRNSTCEEGILVLGTEEDDDGAQLPEASNESGPERQSPHHVTVSWVFGETGPCYDPTDIARYSEPYWLLEHDEDDDLTFDRTLWAGLFRYRDLWVFVDSRCCGTGSAFYCWGSTSITLSHRLHTLLRLGVVPRRRKQCLCLSDAGMKFYWCSLGKSSVLFINN